MTLYTIGHGQGSAATRRDRLVQALNDARITQVIDVRLNPCADDLDPIAHEAPGDWRLQTMDRGIQARLAAEGIGYFWLPELGNPDPQDPAMAILREHIVSDNVR